MNDPLSSVHGGTRRVEEELPQNGAFSASSRHLAKGPPSRSRHRGLLKKQALGQHFPPAVRESTRRGKSSGKEVSPEVRLQLANPIRTRLRCRGASPRREAQGPSSAAQPSRRVEKPFSTSRESRIFSIPKAGCLGFQLTNVTSIYVL